MKIKLFLILFLASTFLIGSVMVTGSQDFHDDPSDQCKDPTNSLKISADPNGAPAFDAKEYYVDKDTCYTLLFENLSLVNHDVNVDAVEGEEGIGEVHIKVENKFGGINGTGVNSMNIQTPDFDTEFELYCKIENHKEEGMVAVLIVGDGNTSSLPFNGYAFIVSLLFLGAIIGKRRS